MAPTICSDKKTQIRSGIKDIRKQSSTSSLSTSPTSAINYAQKRSKLIRPYHPRGKQSPDSFRHHSSDASSCDDTNERYLSPHSPISSISDNSISTSSESSLLSPLSLSSFPSPLTASMTAEACAPCSDRLKPFYHNCDSSSSSSSSVFSISNSQDNIENNDSGFSRSSSIDSQHTVSTTIITDKSAVRPFSLLQLEDEAKNTKGLFDIAIKTIKLVRRNQLLQRRLAQLQLETSEFIQSVLANPENRAIRAKMNAKSSEMI